MVPKAEALRRENVKLVNTRDAMQQLLTGIIVLLVFARIVQMVLKRVQNQKAIPAVVMILVAMLLCFGGVLFYLMYNIGDSGFTLYAALTLLSVTMLGWLLYFGITCFRQMNKKALVLFLTYLLAVLFVTLLSRNGASNSTDIQMELFVGVQKALRTHSMEPVQHMLLNIALFVPLGLLFPMIHKELQSWLSVVTSGMMLSTMIETIQLTAGLGICDIDDILANTLGTIVGYLLFRVVHYRVQ